MSDSTNGSVNLSSGTVSGLLAFLDWVVDRKFATPAAISPLKSASRQIFVTVEGSEDVDDVDVRSLDIEEYFPRFQVAMQSTGRLTPDSVRAYRRRFERAMEMYLEYLNTGQAPRIRTRDNAAVRPKKTVEKRSAKPEASASAAPEQPTEPVTTGAMISYPFPLETGDVASFRLPKRLERRDAARINAFINALIFEPMKELNAGRGDQTE